MPSTMEQTADVRFVDPREAGPKPPFPKQEMSSPGHDTLQPPADHGEKSYVGHGRLQGATAIITGGDSGIGRAIAIAYAREGADVALAFLPEEEPDAESVIKLVQAAGRRAILLPGDITDPSHCDRLVEQTLKEFGKIDVLVNNAAFQRTHQQLQEWSLEEFEHTYRTNVFAPFTLVRSVLPKMKPGASIINTVSVEAYFPKGILLAYASTKGALVTFTKGLAELAIKQGVRVNAVAPGPVWTPLIPSTMPQEQVTKFGSSTLFGRPAQPAELAPAYVFLASNDARFMTATVMDLTGGQMLP